MIGSLILLAALSSSLTTLPAGMPLAEQVASCESSVLGQAIPVAGQVLSLGHLRLHLESGSAAEILASGHPIGLYFKGKGTLEYRSEDRLEHPVMSYNLRKATSLSGIKEGAALVVRDRFDELVWLVREGPKQAATGETSAALAESYAAARRKLSGWEGNDACQFLALAAAAEVKTPLAWAMALGGKEDLGWFHDSAFLRGEALYTIDKPRLDDSELKGELHSTPISEQAIGRDPRDPPVPLFQVTALDVDLKASGGKEAWLTVRETITAIGAPLRALRLGLRGKQYDSKGAGYLAARHRYLRRVVDDKGRALSYDFRRNSVALALAEPVPPGQSVELTFTIDGDFLIRPGNLSYWMLGTFDWFPQPDLNGEYYSSHFTVRVKKPFTAIAPGEVLSRRSEGDDNVLETRLDRPIQFPVILAGDYRVSEVKRGNITFRFSTYAMSNQRAVEQLADLAAGAIEYYEPFLGPFPFREYNIVEIVSYGFGQAPAGILFITQEAFNPMGDVMSQLFSQGVNERFAHEIAHQYWGHVVKMPSLEEQWITESFAEYCAALFLRDNKGKSSYEQLRKHWKARADYATDVSSIALGNRLRNPGDPRDQFLIRAGLIYDKGSWLLYLIHKELGDEKFLTFLKSYQRSFAWKFGTTRHVAGLLKAVSGKDWMPFFEANYWGTGLPDD